MTQRVEGLLSHLESGPALSQLSPLECLDLWYAAGELARGIWSPPLEKVDEREIRVATEVLLVRLRSQVQMRGGRLADCVFSGVESLLARTLEAVRRAELAISSGTDMGALDPDGFEHDVMDRRGRLAYAQEALRFTGLEFPPDLRAVSGTLDARLKELLPKAREVASQRGRPLFMNPVAFPEFFWWRHKA